MVTGMRSVISLSLRNLFAFAVLLLFAVSTADAQIPRFPPLAKTKSPYLKPRSYSGPPLSMALPQSSLNALTHRSTTGHAISSASRIPNRPVAPIRAYPSLSRQTTTQPYFAVPHYDGKNMSRYAVSHALTRGLRF